MRIAAVALVVVLLAACGGGDDDPVLEDAVGADAGFDAGIEITPVDTGVDLPAESVADIGFEIPLEEVALVDVGFQPGPGEAGYPCDNGGDCNEGYCVQTLDGMQCTTTCVDECPFEWACLLYTPLLPDQVYLCMPQFVGLCRPCMANADCWTNGVDAGETCVQYGAGGNFCGGECETDEDCPGGYDCLELADVSGGSGLQCVLSSGECGCSQWDVDNGAETSCTVTNEWGTCSGERVCLEQGLTLCSAATPAEELCNGADDDCDEEIDEDTGGGSCLVMNPFGICPGVYDCDGGSLVCEGQEPQQEVCDGIDNNCDGQTDEGFPDTDNDGKANCLEGDIDGDGIADLLDNCPSEFNPGQADADLDNFGDACDLDDDNDQASDADDCEPYDAGVYPGAEELCDGKDNNCDKLVDEGFDDTDTDGWKDCLDTDDDNDGVIDDADCAPLDPMVFPGSPEQCDGFDNDCDFTVDEFFPDTDEDGAADCVDEDKDGDEVLNDDDNCPLIANADQADQDGDGVGDQCDADEDGDSIPDAVDNCLGVKNTGQSDLDGDGIGDACDEDLDGDGVENEVDNCALVPNAEQEDLDGDGLGDVCEEDKDGDGAADGADCAPEDPQIFPGAEEICDGLDNNCNLIVDEGSPDSDADGWKDCLDDDDDNDGDPDDSDCLPTNPEVFTGALEVCDGVDNDCNGSVDDEIGLLACGKGQCFHVIDACANGQTQWCDPYEGASAEICDGVDNDCDGILDEDQGTSSCGLGQCLHTEPNCVNGESQVCDPLFGEGVEDCDGIDNDCDGQVDEELGQLECGEGICHHSVSVCSGGVPGQCDPFQGAMLEVCDGLDNNCDGEVDEGQGMVSCGKGACEHEQPYCSDGKVTVCDPFLGVSPEVCDGEDNDCDGLADEDLGSYVCGQGACAHAVANCDGGVPGGCDPFLGSDEESCDGKDNNCDGAVDEDLGSTVCGLGLCEHEVANCIGGLPNLCDPMEGWTLEECDGLDNDCDGAIDDGFNDQDEDGEADCVDDDDDGDGDPDETDCGPLDPDVNHDAEEVCFNDIDDNCDGELDPYDVCVPLTCYTLHLDAPDLPSGKYLIDPDGEGGVPPVEVGCDMTTDGGGWTLVMALRADTSNGWHMYSYEQDGTGVSSLPDQLEVNVSVTGVLPKATINAIAAQGEGAYLTDIGKGLFRLNMNTLSMDFYQGIYKSSYSNGYVQEIVFASGQHAPLAEPAWQATDNSMHTRTSCPGSGCHYIPDDVTDGWQWAHRQNATPAAGAANGSPHYSKVFIR